MPTIKKPRPQPAAEPPRWTPLAPPRKNRPLLMAAGVLVAAWIGFLLYLALRT
jgi:hypothetical protein